MTPAALVLHWTVLVYGAADNSCEESFCPDMADLMSALGTPGVEVLAFVDRSPGHSANPHAFGEDFHDSRLYRLTPEGARHVAVDGAREENSGDAATLARAIRWARRTAPSEHFAVVFYSHGNGWKWCPDETDGDALYPAELGAVLEPGDSIDLAVFDVCSMAGVENAYQWRPREAAFGIEVMVATPMAGFPFPWQRVFGRIRDDGAEQSLRPAELTPAAFARLVVSETEAARREELAAGGLEPDERAILEAEAMAALDLGRAAEVKAAVDALARALATWPDGRAALADLRGPTLEPATLHYVGDGPGWAALPYVDAFALAERLAAADDLAVRAAAGEVARAVDALVIASYGLSRYDDHGGFQPGRHGAYVVLPGFDEPQRRPAWSHVRWLHPDPLAGPDAHGGYDWCRDGAAPGDGVVDNWFELLDAWLDDPEGGGSNGYRH